MPDFTTYQKAVLLTMALLGLAITAVAAFLFIIALWDIFGEMHWGNTWGGLVFLVIVVAGGLAIRMVAKRALKYLD